MTGMEEVKDIVVAFLQKALSTKDIKVIGASKTGTQWLVEAEVYEENAFMKSLGLPTRVLDRNLYEVKLDEALEVESYERQGHVLPGS